VVGLGLAASTIIASSSSGLGVGNLLGRPAAPFVPWAVIIVLVAVAEEAILRGRLFDAIRRAGGVGIALAITTTAFALMHVPLYGWHVVPLDLAVGLALGGLRVATGGIAAPAAAHAIADLATWWL
jgi:membrane protease YdiL (CAAX protease family)